MRCVMKDKEQLYAEAEKKYQAQLRKIDRELFIAKSVHAGATVITVDPPFVQYKARSIEEVMSIVKSMHVMLWKRVLGKGWHYTQEASLPVTTGFDPNKTMDYLFRLSTTTSLGIRSGTALSLRFNIRTTQAELCSVWITLCDGGKEGDYQSEYWNTGKVGPIVDIQQRHGGADYRFNIRQEMRDLFDVTTKESSGSNSTCNISHFITLDAGVEHSNVEHYWAKLEKVLQYIYQ